ncbi:uncharacterized protein LOC141617199 [Silene latifolia]|uniref:uncharacterized protein LOC141617199 n=1 Tax=Silene latifolia TaxID=37657 RepID=UPI003D775A69
MLTKIGGELGMDKGKGSGNEAMVIPLSSPLFLYPSDSPSLKLTHAIFNGDNYDIWADSCNAKIKDWLQNVIDEKLHPTIAFISTVVEIWKELKERYAAGNAPRVHQLKSDLTECRQEKRSVVDYYTHLKSIWDELTTYSRVPVCTCGAAAEFLKEKEAEKVHQFIMGINTALYDNLHSNLLMDDDLTYLNRVYALVLREERHKAVTCV